MPFFLKLPARCLRIPADLAEPVVEKYADIASKLSASLHVLSDASGAQRASPSAEERTAPKKAVRLIEQHDIARAVFERELLHAAQARVFHRDARFLIDLADHRGRERLARLHMPAGKDDSRPVFIGAVLHEDVPRAVCDHAHIREYCFSMPAISSFPCPAMPKNFPKSQSAKRSIPSQSRSTARPMRSKPQSVPRLPGATPRAER